VIVDSSALIAILSDEPEQALFNDALARADVCQMSAATFVEVSIVVEASRGYDGVRDLDLLIATAGIVVVPVDVEQAHVAREAYRQYGKGRQTGARLNYGDCFSYALARVTALPLLFKGEDFSQTDIAAAV
jgi:ribonuclease VapC